MSTAINNLVKGAKTTLDLLRSRSFAIVALTLSLAGVVMFVTEQINVVYIRDGEEVIQIYTLKENPQDILNDQGIIMMAHDTMSFTQLNDGSGEIEISRGFPVTVTVDGITHSYMATDDITVGALLDSKGIRLKEHDMLNLPRQFYLSADDQIIIQRVILTTTVVEEEIPYETEYRQNSLLKPGRSETLIAGVKGSRTITYADRIVDGVLQQREVVSNVVTKDPVTRLVLKGGKGAISDLDFGYKMDQNGKPIGYSYVLQNQIATGYSAKPGRNIGASRMRLFYGYVAVNPNEIPYGSKLYVTSADNKFVYGYCIAADTGTGLMQGIIDIDLYYETYRESQLNGRQIVNIYVLPR